WYSCLNIGKSKTLIIYQHVIEGYVNVAFVISPLARTDAIIWCVNTTVINFQMVKWYAGDRVFHQFGHSQHIPD
ncbi:hypothetical protein J1N35_038727, partial [Gossypium stocksii]